MKVFSPAVVGFMVWFVPGTVAMGCSEQGLTEKMSKCLSISTADLSSANADEVLSSYCKNIECNLKCFTDAIGDCYKQDAFFTFNPDVLKATNRAFCNNQVETMSTFNNCQWTNPSCLSNLTTAVNAAETEYRKGNFAAYKSKYCSALTAVNGCIRFSVTSSCTTVMASLAKDFYQASFSFTTCGIQAHPYLSKYGGNVTNVKCGGSNLSQSVTAVLVYLTLYVLGQFL